ncbi:CoA transferase subunit A [Candidatus Formimonas warabiya]|uniref:Acyl CoA--acetate/3-ketoacid CoA transferase subunit alpha n=1 Tax=Formimonas warabiya TaxID=1761012 RepID=A0A3G1KSM1_FORW1|nr:CoA-transferase [Candidatus Formimonas warabiya]ATW25513.1 acyl CoA--acetate/3-ketoacid CoA transferase subunit alpha [Candidatus Formimonas warabiya]
MSKLKIITLKEAAALVHDGDQVAFSGFTIWRRPVALCYELIRQGKKDLHLFEVQGGYHSDLLVGAGCVKIWEGAWMGQEMLGKIGENLARKQISGEVLVDDYSHGHTAGRLMAGALGLPFFPCALAMGTDIFNPEYDQLAKAGLRDGKHRHIPAQKYVMAADPFFHRGECLLLPAVNPDVALVYAPVVGDEGTVRVLSQSYNDAEVIKASRTVIVICEEIVPDSYLRRDPGANLVSGHEIDYVVECPWAAHPTGSQFYYDADAEFLKNYNRTVRDQNAFDAFAEKWIFGVSCHEEYLEKLGTRRLEELRASQILGYSTRVKRGTR